MQIAAIGDHVQILSGFAFKSELFNNKNKGIPLVRIRDVKPGFSSTYYDGDFDEKFILTNGDLLVGMDGEFNCKRWQGGKALLNQRVCRIQSSSSSLDEQYLYYFLPKALKRIEDKSNFVTVKHLSVTQIKKIEIPLPPIEEQRRIAAILDQADGLRRKRQEAIRLTEELLRATFLDMFGDPITNPKGWEVKFMSEAIQKINAGWSIGGEDRPLHAGEWGVLKISSVTSGRFIQEEYKSVGKPPFAKSTIVPKKGDLLFSRANTRELVAATCLVEKDCNNLFLPDKIWQILPDREIANSEYLKFLLSDEKYRHLLSKKATGTSGSMLNISQKKLLEMPTPMPPIQMQNDFANRVWRMFTLRKRHEKGIEKSNALFNSLLQRAFRGEL